MHNINKGKPWTCTVDRFSGYYEVPLAEKYSNLTMLNSLLEVPILLPKITLRGAEINTSDEAIEITPMNVKLEGNKNFLSPRTEEEIQSFHSWTPKRFEIYTQYIYPNAPRPPGGRRPPGAEAGRRPAVAGAAAFSKKSHAFLMYAQSEC